MKQGVCKTISSYSLHLAGVFLFFLQSGVDGSGLHTAARLLFFHVYTQLVLSSHWSTLALFASGFSFFVIPAVVYTFSWAASRCHDLHFLAWTRSVICTALYHRHVTSVSSAFVTTVHDGLGSGNILY